MKKNHNFLFKESSFLRHVGHLGFGRKRVFWGQFFWNFFCGFFMIYSNKWMQKTFCYYLFHVQIKFTPLGENVRVLIFFYFLFWFLASPHIPVKVLKISLNHIFKNRVITCSLFLKNPYPKEKMGCNTLIVIVGP